jgi:hypothetical protein
MLCIYYCAPDMQYINEAPQIHIKYRPSDETLEEFIQRHKDQTIYIEIEKDYNLFRDRDSLKRFIELKQFDNWVLQIPIELITKHEYSEIIDNTKFEAIKDCCNKYIQQSNRIYNCKS